MANFIKLTITFASTFFIVGAVNAKNFTDNEMGYNYFQAKNGYEQNFSKALTYFERSANSGNADSQYIAGTMYYLGRGVEMDIPKGLRYLQQSADQNYGIAQFSIAMSYLQNKGVPVNKTKGLEYFEKASINGFKLAGLYAGDFYFFGDSVEKNYQKALKNYTIALEYSDIKPKQQGDIYKKSAKMFYDGGYGLKKDLNRAQFFANKAIQKGTNAVQLLKDILSEIEENTYK